MGLKINLFDILSRLSTYDKKIGVITNGINNEYPDKIDRFINNSVTAKSAANIMAVYIAGQGFLNSNSKKVSKGVDLKLFTNKVAKSIAKHHGVFIHVMYDANGKKVSFDTLPYSHCRLGKKDDTKYNGKIAVYDDWSAKRIDKSKITWIDVYNPIASVVESQIRSSKGDDLVDKAKNYKGQVWYINLDEEYDYALSTIDAVQYDCDSEAQSSAFKNKSLRKGFFGKTVVVTRPLVGAASEYETPEAYQSANSERKNFKDTIENFIGAENAGGILHVELEQEQDDLDDAIKFENISSDIDDKLFSYTESSVFLNILMAFNNLPAGLVRSDTAMFSNSGDSLREMKKDYQDNTRIERNVIEDVVNELLGSKDGEYKITPLIVEVKPVEEDGEFNN